jgi:hypothetical protein
MNDKGIALVASLPIQPPISCLEWHRNGVLIFALQQFIIKQNIGWIEDKINPLFSEWNHSEILKDIKPQAIFMGKQVI